MSLRTKIEDKIRKKEAEIEKAKTELTFKIREASAYVQALQEMLKMLPKEENTLSPEKTLKQGSGPRKTYDYLLSVGRPLYINDIMEAIGMETTKQNRATLASSLNLYVNKNQIFTRPAPGTFGLINMEDMEVVETELPDNFG